MLNRISRLLFRNGYSVFVDSAPATATRAIPVIKIQGMRKIGSFLEDQNTVKKIQQFDEENRDASVQQLEKQEKQEKDIEEQIQIITSKKKSLWGLYNESLRTHPLLVKSITALVIVGFGDVLSQLLVSTGSFDYLRLVRMCALGGAFVGPTLHFWFLALSKLFPSKSVATTISRVIIDQSIFTVFFLTCFFGLLLLMEGHPQDLPDKLKNDMWSVILANWKVWIPAQAINFWLIPPQFQVLYANMIGLAWNIYLSSVANKK